MVVVLVGVSCVRFDFFSQLVSLRIIAAMRRAIQKSLLCLRLPAILLCTLVFMHISSVLCLLRFFGSVSCGYW